MQDDAEQREETGPSRTCIATRAVRPIDELIRFVVGTDGSVVADLRRKLPGRGVWVSADAAAVGQAVRRKAFARAFRRSDLVVPAGLADVVESGMRRDALQSLALANKAGQVTTGAAKVEAALAGGRIRVLVHASDGGPDGQRKLEQVHFRHFGESGRLLERIKFFSSEELDLALGRTNVIHAALAEGGACEAFLTRCRRLGSYRPDSSAAARDGSDTQTLGDVQDAGERAGETVNGHGPGI